MRDDGQSLAKEFLALGCLGLIVAICGCATGQNVRKTKIACAPGPDFSQAFSYNGKRLLTLQGNVVRLWDVETGQELQRFQGHTGSVTAVTLSPDGKQALTADATHTNPFIKGESVRLWDIATGREIRRLQTQTGWQAGWVFDVQFSPDGSRVLTAQSGTTNTIQIWDVKTGRRLFVFPRLWLYSFGSPSVLSVNFSPDSRRLVEIVDTGGRVKVWDATTGKEVCTIEKDTGCFFTCAQFSPDGKLVLTGSCESGRTWNEKITPDGKTIRVPSSGGAARTWDAKTGKLVQEFSGHTNQVCQALFTSDGRRIVTASHDGSARLWDAKTGKEIRRFENAVPGPIEQMVLSTDGKRLITRWRGHDPATVRYFASLWDVESGREITQLTNELGEIVGFSPVDQKFMVLKERRPAALWDGATGKIIRKYD